MNIQADCRWTPAQWYNAQDYEVSYKRMYKSASSTIVDLLGAHSRDSEAKFAKRFTVIRDPVGRAKSIYKELESQGLLAMRGIHSFSAYLEYTWKEGYFNKHQFPQAFWIPECEIRIFRLDQLDDVCNYIGVQLPRNLKRQIIKIVSRGFLLRLWLLLLRWQRILKESPAIPAYRSHIDLDALLAVCLGE